MTSWIKLSDGRWLNLLAIAWIGEDHCMRYIGGEAHENEYAAEIYARLDALYATDQAKSEVLGELGLTLIDNGD